MDLFGKKDIDTSIRLATFQWLEKQVELHGDVLPLEIIRKGVPFSNSRIHLVSASGIFKPRQLEFPLTITTSPNSPYKDSLEEEFISYRYRGTDPYHRDNVGLREAMKRNLPLVYFLGIVPGRYLPVWPVYVIGDDKTNLTFTVAVDKAVSIQDDRIIVDESSKYLQSYYTQSVKVRVHQRKFRERVLRAYRQCCAFCRLRHEELLDAAHIIPDRDQGPPTVPNGLALCKLHHAAFDRNFISVSPDFEIYVRRDILEEIDGPMLQHGLQGLHQGKILLPRSRNNWPDRDLLARRFERFQEAV